MSVNSSKAPTRTVTPSKRWRWWLLIALPAWVFVSFGVAQLVIVSLVQAVVQAGVALDTIDATILNTSLAAVIYGLTLLIAMGVPKLLQKYTTSWRELGLDRLPRWADIGFAPAAYVGYLVVLTAVTAALVTFVPSYDIQQTQEVGFEALSFRYEYILAFITLVIIAPVAEEVLFRGYLYGKLRRAVPLWAAILATSALFAAVHGQWNVAVDTFILSVFMCGLREITGSIWAGILLHMIKNGVAYYFLFIDTSLIQSLM